MGTNAVGAMIVAGPEGFRKNAYRKFNIKRPETVPGDDFAMMREVLGRRFARLEKEDPDKSRGEWPDLMLIDGGKGQLSAVCEVMEDAGVHDVPVVAISKGPDRNAGREVFHLPGGREITLPPNDPVLFYLQRLRDEAHRFAIGAHRTKRDKSMAVSILEEVPGIGPRRKRALLMHFGTAPNGSDNVRTPRTNVPTRVPPPSLSRRSSVSPPVPPVAPTAAGSSTFPAVARSRCRPTLLACSTCSAFVTKPTTAP